MNTWATIHPWFCMIFFTPQLFGRYDKYLLLLLGKGGRQVDLSNYLRC